MSTKIFVNLAVQDLDKTKAFFTKLGFSFNPQFTDDKAACMVIGEDNYVMLLVKDFFKTFTKKELCDAKKSTEVLIALSAESKEKVDKLVDAALAAGGSSYKETEDHGWMYQRSFADLDGHQWEIIYMDMNAVPHPQA